MDAVERELRHAEIADLYHSGEHTLKAIGAMIGVSRQRVHQILKHHGLATRPPKPRTPIFCDLRQKLAKPA